MRRGCANADHYAHQYHICHQYAHYDANGHPRTHCDTDRYTERNAHRDQYSNGDKHPHHSISDGTAHGDPARHSHRDANADAAHGDIYADCNANAASVAAPSAANWNRLYLVYRRICAKQQFGWVASGSLAVGDKRSATR